MQEFKQDFVDVDFNKARPQLQRSEIARCLDEQDDQMDAQEVAFHFLEAGCWSFHGTASGSCPLQGWHF